jgi:hypothetical protein
MATLAAQIQTLDGLDPTLAAADAAGDDFANTGAEYLDVNNASAGAVTVTCNATRACNQGFDHNAVVSVPAGARRRIGPFSTDRFGQSVAITYSSATSVTVGVVRV